ncbi:MAG: ribosome maturation factor RimP, partial [Pseudomonadota bacterium]|nr:ribosome maturation factor RimP [Pseudomonadota bacterium]
SPGLDRPLFTAAHFARLLGAEVRVTLKLPQHGRRRLRGRVQAVDGQQVTVNVDTVPFTFTIDAFESARLIPDWVALGYAPQPKQGVIEGNSKPASRGRRATRKLETPPVSQ